jgi:hypothetical protein
MNKIKKIRKELNNYELSRTKDLIQENSRNSRKSTKLPKFSRNTNKTTKRFMNQDYPISQ